MNQKHRKIYIDSVTNNRQHQYNHILIKKQRILKVNEYELKTNNRNHKKTYIYEKDIHI